MKTHQAHYSFLAVLLISALAVLFLLSSGQTGVNASNNETAPRSVLTGTVPTATPPPNTSPTAIPTVVPDTSAPQVIITNPLNGDSVKRNTLVTIKASASDNVGVTRVLFYVNGQLLCTDTASPYACTWKVLGPRGSRMTLSATAYDAAGNSGTHSVSVTLR